MQPAIGVDEKIILKIYSCKIKEVPVKGTS
jgi:hypothetical protein